MKHIVFVCQVFYPDSGATSQLFTDVFRALSRDDGIRVSVITGFPYKMFDHHAMALPRYEQFGDIDIYRCGLNIDTKKNRVFRALAYVTFLLHAAWKLIRLRQVDTVFGVTNPPFLAIMLWLTSYISRFSYDFMFLDIYPEGAIRLQMISETSILTRIWVWLNKRGYQRANRLAVLGRDMIPLLTGNYGVPEEKIVYIPHWSSVQVDRPLAFEDSPMVSRLNVQDKFVVQYSGNMGIWNDIETLVRAAVRVQSNKYLQFVFIGGGFRRPPAQEMSEQLEVQNIIWHDFVPREELTESLAACHVSLISLNTGLEGIAVPSKLYGILASGRAIVAQVPRGSEIALVVEEEGCGLVVEPGDVEGLASALVYLSERPEMVREMGERAFAAYCSKYTLDHAVQAFKSFLHIQ
jgi:glycosyltransferase involved in cell wall biosynthesis